MAAATAAEWRVGHWCRQPNCAFSQVCSECRVHDTQQAALRRQRDAAGDISEQPRRLVMSINGDMKGLMTLAGHAGPNATYNCLFCMSRNNQTNVAGLPCLRHPPEPWASSPAFLDRPLEVRDPPPRGGTDKMKQLAAEYIRDAADKKDLSSADYESCASEPLFWSDDLQEHVSRTPLHILLGIGTNRINQIEAECLQFDQEWAMNSGNEEIVNAFAAAYGALNDATLEVERIEAELRSHQAAKRICLSHDDKAAKRGRVTAADKDVWVVKYRKAADAEKTAESELKSARRQLEKATKDEATTREAALKSASTGPFATRFAKFLSDLKISRQKYFGGTFVGPDLHCIFSSRENIANLAGLLRPGQFK